jgi:hypothetical protein
MLGHRLLGDVEVLGDGAGAELTVTDEAEDPPPLRVGDGLEGRLGVGALGQARRPR